MPDPVAAPAAVAGDPAPVAVTVDATTTTAATDPAAPVAGVTPATVTADPAPDPNAWTTKRTAYANGDAKVLARLSRYSSEKDVVDALIATQNKMASSRAKEPLPENPTAEEMAAWRAENGIPLTAKDYGVEVPEGVDPAQTEEFLATAHELNMTPTQVEKVMGWKIAADQKAAEQLAERDATSRQEGTEALKTDWGPEYKLNINLVTGLLDTAPQGFKDQIMGSRLADGTLFGNSPDALRWLATLAREINPTATVVPGSGVNAAQAIQSEMQNLEKMMGDRSSEYWKGPKAETMQKRYRDLADVKVKVKQ